MQPGGNPAEVERRLFGRFPRESRSFSRSGLGGRSNPPYLRERCQTQLCGSGTAAVLAVQGTSERDLMTVDPGFRMHAERTPNPNSIKWVLGQTIVEDRTSAHFESPPTPEVSPLAARLFEVDGVSGVFVASNFVTVTKRPEIEWTEIAQPIVDVIKACLADGDSALGPAYEVGEQRDEGELERRIRQVIDDEVRPAVAMDGGDIVFAGFRDGVVELYMQGSCSGCPSSTATLKMGIEARLREVIPEVQEVVAL